MASPTELSFEEILKFMLAHNGKVTNHELVKHFKVFLMNPEMRDEARNTFKKHVNTLAIIKNQNNEKWLILKKKYIPNNDKPNEDTGNKMSESNEGTAQSSTEPEQPPPRPPLPVALNQDFSIIANLIQDNQSPVFEPAVETSITESKDSLASIVQDVPPKVHPRRRSSDKVNEKNASIQTLHRSSIPNEDIADVTMSPVLPSSRSESMLTDNEQIISVKERKQMFNRMASESDVLKSNKLSGNFSPGVDEDDRASLDHKSETDPLDSKQKQWILCAARGDYHTLAKMCKENVKLVKTKDPFTNATHVKGKGGQDFLIETKPPVIALDEDTKTAMHWACKRGDENLVKLLAGAGRYTVNERSGYTPLHIAMQFRHENVYRLLVEVYDADPNARDWSGRKARQYLVHRDTSLSPGSYRKKESFLRIGSLNVRVKKTTEAFSNFLGVGATRSSAYVPKNRDRDVDRRSDSSDQLHKSWGSVDNIQKEDKLMPPPMSGKVKRRGANGRRGLAVHSTPSTPDQPRAQIGGSEEGDSDSDSAAGFHAAWRQQRASCT